MTRNLIQSDNFNRAGPALGANWTSTNPAASSDLVIVASTAVAGQFSRTYDITGGALWSGSGAFTDDQYASIVIGGLANQTTSYGIGVICRATGADATRSYYGAYVCSDAVSGGTQTTVLFKIISGTATSLNTGTSSWSNGDRIELEVQGSAIRLCKNGTYLGGAWSVTDTSIATGGTPGVIGGGAGVATGDDWQGGSITSSAGTPTMGQMIFALQ